MKTLVERLLVRKDDRGLMANLRCALVPGKLHRAWPALNRLGIQIDKEEDVFVAGLFATHPEVTNKGNFGTLCKLIAHKRDASGTESSVSPTERRFQHVLAANRDEAQGRILRLVRMAKAEGLSVNYEQLRTDLYFWNDRVKIEWAKNFWTVGTKTEGEES